MDGQGSSFRTLCVWPMPLAHFVLSQTNASVTKLPGKSETAKEIALQGNLLHDIPRLLLSEYGIGQSFVDVKSKGK